MNKFFQLVIGAIFVAGAVTDFNAGHYGGATGELIIGIAVLIDLVFKWCNQYEM